MTASSLPPPSDGEVPEVDNTTSSPRKATVEVNAAEVTKPKITQSNGVLNIDKHAIPLNDNLAYTPRKLRVVTIGAGFSGLLMAHNFQHRNPEMQEFVEHTIFEGRHQVGGTWLMNTYPGVQCDVPSHVYAFPFDPNPNWSHFYSSGAEIQEYMIRTTKKWNLDRDIQLNTKVTRAIWQAKPGLWKLTVEHEGKSRDEFADILISGQGVLLHHQWPDIPGLRHFKGHITHSAAWDHDFDYSNKRIAVIGNGSSGIQIVPQMVALPGTKVVNFIRGPTYIYYRVPPSKHLGRAVDEVNPSYTEEEKKNWRENPDDLREYRKGIVRRVNKAFRMFIKGSEGNLAAIKSAAEQMSEKLGHDPVLCEKLIPKWEVGCRRVTPGPGYLEAVTQDNCELTNSPITKINENGVHTADGKFYDVDVVVCATGFDVSHCPRYPIVGLGGIDLAEKWKDEPESYMSVATSDMPNYFIMMGPNAVVGHGSLVEALNWTADYIAKWIRKIATEDIKSVVPKRSVVDAFVKYGDNIHKTLVWTGSCKSWYKRNRVDGRVTALFGGSSILYKQLISDIRGEDFDIEYRSPNPFRFMGNGFTAYEMDEGNDLAWYIEN